jgi:hypothetical protein
VQRHEAAHQGESDAKPRAGAWSRRIGLREEIKHVRQGVRRDADTRVSEANDDLTVSHVDKNGQLTLRIGIS